MRYLVALLFAALSLNAVGQMQVDFPYNPDAENNKSSFDKSQWVNLILGDISYESEFGHKPDATTDNNLRIRTHLEYVENLLRNKNVSDLSTDLQTQRNHLLDLLHDYWTNGIFPKNYDYADQRKPCFIDKDGTICAVGYLLEQTTSRQVADEINSKHKYDELLAMNNSIVDNWVLTSGLTKEECAMIQPTYGGCTDPESPCYNPMATYEEEGECCVSGCTISVACNYDPDAEYQLTGSCDFSTCAGCMDETACNWDPEATIDDGSCEYLTCQGCTDDSACNYDAIATISDDESCEYPEFFGYNCNDDCLSDTDGDGICDPFEIPGCTDYEACNYNPEATDNDSCEYIADGECDCDGNQLDALGICGGDCEDDYNGNGVCDNVEIYGCAYPDAMNFDPFATADNGSCAYTSNPCPTDLDGNGSVGSQDLLIFLGAFGNYCE